MKYYILLILTLLSIKCFPKTDSLVIQDLNARITILGNKVDEIKRDQLNYSLEKDLLKETYSNNYDRINIFLTILLGLFGLLSFLGLRDINSIKKEYKEELDKLRDLQTSLESKSLDFEMTKKKYDDEIQKITQQNEEQNKKIKALELKEKITELYNKGNYNDALEYCIIALELDPSNSSLMSIKANIYSKKHDHLQAIDIYEKVIEANPNDTSTVLNLIELYYTSNANKKANALRQKYLDIIRERGELNDFFDVCESFNNKDFEPFKKLVLLKIDVADKKRKTTRIIGWDFSEYNYFLSKEPESILKSTIQYYIQYLTGDITPEDANASIEKLA